MSFGKGASYSMSCKQKLNTKSSMEVELVAIDDALGQILWTCHFLNGQGIVTPDGTKTTRAQYCLQKMEGHPVAGIPKHLDMRYFL